MIPAVLAVTSAASRARCAARSLPSVVVSRGRVRTAVESGAVARRWFSESFAIGTGSGAKARGAAPPRTTISVAAATRDAQTRAATRNTRMKDGSSSDERRNLRLPEGVRYLNQVPHIALLFK